MEAFGLDPIRILWHLVNFGILLFVLSRFVFPRVLSMLDERAARIQEGITLAEENKRAAAEIESQRLAVLDEARREGAALHERARQNAAAYEDQLRREAEAEAVAIRSRAESEAAAIRAQAVTEVREQVAELAIQAAERIVRDSLDGQRQRKLVEDFLTSMTVPGGGR